MHCSAETEPPLRLKVGITYNQKHSASPDYEWSDEAEFDDEDTIRAIQSALEAAGLAVELYEATEDLPIRLIQNRPDIVFNIAEGTRGRGREAQVPAILNYLNIPFTGSDETTLCIAMDKALTKRIASSYGIRTPAYEVVKSGTFLQATPPNPAFEWSGSFPLIVKPNSEGSSKGISDISIVNDAAALRHVLTEKINAYKQDMLLEEYISGREFTVGILGNGEALRVFPPMEIIFIDKARSIYSYEVKRNFRRYVRYECPPDIDAALREEIEETAETVYRALECRDFARMDFRLSPDNSRVVGSPEGRLYFIEINPLSGLAPGYSDFPMIAEFCGMDYKTLIWNILDSALARYGLRNRV